MRDEPFHLRMTGLMVELTYRPNGQKNGQPPRGCGYSRCCGGAERGACALFAAGRGAAAGAC